MTERCQERWGAVKCLALIDVAYRCLSHSQIFFLQPEDLRNSNAIKDSKAQSFQRWSSSASVRKAYLFSQPPGGASKSFRSFDHGPVPPRHKLFREFPKSFFGAQLSKIAAKFRVGGVIDDQF
jgi:hypothetical protein